MDIDKMLLLSLDRAVYDNATDLMVKTLQIPICKRPLETQIVIMVMNGTWSDDISVFNFFLSIPIVNYVSLLSGVQLSP